MSKVLDKGGVMVLSLDSYTDEDGLNLTLDVEVSVEKNGHPFVSTFNLIDMECNTAASRNEFMKHVNACLGSPNDVVNAVTEEVFVPLYLDDVYKGSERDGLDIRMIDTVVSEDGSLIVGYEYDFELYQLEHGEKPDYMRCDCPECQAKEQAASRARAEARRGEEERSPEGAQAAADGVNRGEKHAEDNPKCKDCPAYDICHNMQEDAEVLAEMFMKLFPPLPPDVPSFEEFMEFMSGKHLRHGKESGCTSCQGKTNGKQ